MKLSNHTSILLALLSASILAFEVVATRVASVVFVSDMAYIIISVGILGLGGGGWLAHVTARVRALRNTGSHAQLFLLLGALYCLFAVPVTLFSITSPLLFFPLLLAPFVLGGYLAALLYRFAPGSGFTAYASDLGGAVVGSLMSLGIISLFGGTNAVMVLALIAWGAAGLSLVAEGKGMQAAIAGLVVVVGAAGLAYNGQRGVLGEIAIGIYPEKDFYTVYPDPSVRARIVDSRWSVFGRADLVAYSHQDLVMQLFVDGAAGSQVYRFNGDTRHTNPHLHELLLHHTNAIPFLCLADSVKRRMLVIGPGGGKEILLGLLGGAGSITGVEVNPDFVALVKGHRAFTGGIYTDFPSVSIIVDEGRRYVRQVRDSVDLLVMALPSTAQMQSIEPFATNENFLLTREALGEYLRILASRGALVLTVHNPWELSRLLVMAVSVFQDAGIPAGEIPDHFVMLESDYAPTVVIKKLAFTSAEALRWQEVCGMLPPDYPRVTYLPHGMHGTGPSALTAFLKRLSLSPASLRSAVMEHPLNVAPSTDDSPYFYNRLRSGPRELYWLLAGVGVWCVLVVALPWMKGNARGGRLAPGSVKLPVIIAMCSGSGFMIVEIALLQKMVLYIGAPTTSLAVLLAILLAGAGFGSLLGRVLGRGYRPEKVLVLVAGLIILMGVVVTSASSFVLQGVMLNSYGIRLGAVAALLMPLAVVLGVPFPLALRMLKEQESRHLVPWVYAINCSFGVLGSVAAIVVSMLAGFREALILGVACYGVLIVMGFRRFAPPDEGSLAGEGLSGDASVISHTARGGD
jgi:hypothetical protein